MKKANMLSAIATALSAGLSAQAVRNLPMVRKYNREENHDRCFENKLAKRRAKNKRSRKARRMQRLRAK